MRPRAAMLNGIAQSALISQLRHVLQDEKNNIDQGHPSGWDLVVAKE
jgi:hypothetical protein